ncbi:hypothetical protein Poly21_13870 [Allorhodopirellula heiligendammensis]|uniref:Uncharacterized protein n=1 Tax=Allorhodopirellula heiligendammensis TaxID=2714739 RepID=A0A5C6C6W8_9BACT|nr:hypothetical protein Poly21_13870 [Allorhodopirellula heiligendammensis]
MPSRSSSPLFRKPGAYPTPLKLCFHADSPHAGGGAVCESGATDDDTKNRHTSALQIDNCRFFPRHSRSCDAFGCDWRIASSIALLQTFAFSRSCQLDASWSTRAWGHSILSLGSIKPVTSWISSTVTSPDSLSPSSLTLSPRARLSSFVWMNFKSSNGAAWVYGDNRSVTE